MVPSLFIAHGSPILAIEETPYTDFLGKLGQSIKPKAIVLFTAHWESDVLTISTVDGVYDTIYDFYGFPEELYQIKYKAKGSPEVAAAVASLLNEQGIETQEDPDRGLDHGSWTILLKMYPQADVPIVQISVDPFLEPEKQLRIGAAVRELRKQNIAVIGSGVTVHNLRMLDRGRTDTESDPWAAAFDDWLIEHTLSRDTETLANYMELAPYAKQAVPRPEHFVPFFIAMGAGDLDQSPSIIHRSYRFGTLSYLCFQF